MTEENTVATSGFGESTSNQIPPLSANLEPTQLVPVSKPKQIPPKSDSSEKSVPTNNTESLISNSFNYSTEMQIKSFQELKLNSELLKSLQSNGFSSPTDLQTMVLSPLTQGRSMLIESPHASGKLASLSIALLHRSNLTRVALQALVITKTVDSCSDLELALSSLSEDATAIKLDDLDDVLAGEIAEHHFMMGSEAKTGLICDVITSIKSRIVLCLYNVNLGGGELVEKIVENKFKFFQIVIMQDFGEIGSYEFISQLLGANTVYFASNSPSMHVDKIIHILKGKQTNNSTVSNNTHEQTPVIDSTIIQICQKLESGEKVLGIFQKYNISPNSLQIFYIFVLHYLIKGVNVVQTGYKPSDRIQLLSIVAKEFSSQSNIPVQVVVCHDGKELNGSTLSNDRKVFLLKNEDNLSDIPPDKTIVIASSAKTLSVLKSFPTLFQGTGRLILFLNTQTEKFKEICGVFPDKLLFLAMLKCQIGSVENQINIPFVHVTKHESNLNLFAFQGAQVSPGEMSCIELVPKSSPEIPVRSKPVFKNPRNQIPDLAESDRALPNIVSVGLLETISSKHGINPKCILSFYPELFSFAVRGDNVLLIGFPPNDFTPIVNLIVLEKANSGTAPGCQVVLFAPHLKSPLSEYPHCTQLTPSTEENILNISPIVRVKSVSDVIRLYSEQGDKFRRFKKLIVLIGVKFDECVELIAEQMHCQFLLVLSDIPSGELFEDFPQIFVRFLNENGSIRFERVGKEISDPIDEFTPELPEDSTPSPETPSDPTSLTVLDLQLQYQTDTTQNSEFFKTVLTHVFKGDNVVITNFYQDIVTILVTILYQEYAIRVPGGGHTLVCLGSKISDLLLPAFKCPSSLWLKDNVSVLSLPSKQKETFFLTIAKMLHILNNEFDFLVKRKWFIMFIGLSHQETQNCIPFIPLSNQYLFILSIDHPQFKKFMSAPYIMVNSSRRKPVVTEWVHRGRMKSFNSEYKQHSEAMPYVNDADCSANSEYELTLRNVTSSMLNSGKNILLQSRETNILFEYILHNIDKKNRSIQAIFSSPTVIASVNVFSRINKYLRLRNEKSIKVFLYSKGTLDQLSRFLTKDGFHVLVTSNDSLSGILKQRDVIKECCLIVFDCLIGRQFLDQSERILPRLLNTEIPRRIQSVLRIDEAENTSNFVQQLQIPLYHIQETKNISSKICFCIECYF